MYMAYVACRARTRHCNVIRNAQKVPSIVTARNAKRMLSIVTARNAEKIPTIATATNAEKMQSLIHPTNTQKLSSVVTDPYTNTPLTPSIVTDPYPTNTLKITSIVTGRTKAEKMPSIVTAGNAKIMRCTVCPTSKSIVTDPRARSVTVPPTNVI